MVFNTELNEKGFFPKTLMEISIIDLHNNMIKPYDNGGLESVFDSVPQKALISDTTLRSFIPPQVRKMTPKLYHICGCELFIIPKDICFLVYPRVYNNWKISHFIYSIKTLIKQH